MRLAKKLEPLLTLQEQLDNLKKRVIIKNPDFKNQTGILCSIRLYKGYYVLLDKSYKVSDGFYSRTKHFKEKEIRIIE